MHNDGCLVIRNETLRAIGKLPVRKTDASRYVHLSVFVARPPIEQQDLAARLHPLPQSNRGDMRNIERLFRELAKSLARHELPLEQLVSIVAPCLCSALQDGDPGVSQLASEDG